MTTSTSTTHEEIPTKLRPDQQPSSRPRQAGLWVVVAAILILLVLGILFVLRSRQNDLKDLQENSKPATTVALTVIHPEPAKGAVEIELPGDTEAYTDTPIYSRADGYLRRWLVDIGACSEGAVDCSDRDSRIR